MVETNRLKWVREPKDKLIAGVATGLAQMLDVAPWVIRLLWVIAAMATFGLAVLVYVACVVALPRSDQSEEALQKMILGVCVRIHQRGDLEVGLARLGALLLLFATGGTAIVGYIVLHFVLTQNPETEGSK